MYDRTIANNHEALLSTPFTTAPSSPTTRDNDNHGHDHDHDGDDLLLDSPDDFDFSARSSDAGGNGNGYGYASTTTSPMSSAEDLFLNGKIRPLNSCLNPHHPKLGAHCSQDYYYYCSCPYCPHLQMGGHETSALDMLKRSSLDIQRQSRRRLADIVPDLHRAEICHVMPNPHHYGRDINHIMPKDLHGGEAGHTTLNHPHRLEFCHVMPDHYHGSEVGRIMRNHHHGMIGHIMQDHHHGKIGHIVPNHHPGADTNHILPNHPTDSVAKHHIVPNHHREFGLIAPNHPHGGEISNVMPNHHGNENSANYHDQACHVMPKHHGKMNDIMSNHCGKIDHVFLNHHGPEIRHYGDVKNTDMHPYDDNNKDVKDISMHHHLGDIKGIKTHGHNHHGDVKNFNVHPHNAHYHGDVKENIVELHHYGTTVANDMPYNAKCVVPHNDGVKVVPNHQHCHWPNHAYLRHHIETKTSSRNVHLHTHRRTKTLSPMKVIYKDAFTNMAPPRFSFESLIYTSSHDHNNAPKPIKRTLKDLLGDNRMHRCDRHIVFSSAHHECASSQRPLGEVTKKRTFIPFGGSLLACFGFTTKSYSSTKGLQVLN